MPTIEAATLEDLFFAQAYIARAALADGPDAPRGGHQLLENCIGERTAEDWTAKSALSVYDKRLSRRGSRSRHAIALTSRPMREAWTPFWNRIATICRSNFE